MLMKLLFLTNIPSPYRIDFYNELGKYADVTVVFEARRVEGINFNWNDCTLGFNAIFLSDGNIQEKKVNKRILKYIRRDVYDYVFITNYAYYTEFAALLKIKLLRIRYVMEIDGAILRDESVLKYCFKKMLIKGATAYFSPSRESDKVLLHYGVKENRIMRYPFSSLRESDIIERIPTKSEKEIVKSELGIFDEKVILCVGQFIPRKGNDVLIKAARIIKNKVGIYFVGGIPGTDYIQLVESNNLSNIHFVEFQSKEELEKYYRAADIFVLPTREDVWGLVINEAMANGLPVITTERCVAGIELVKENGYIVPADDEIVLAKEIDKILDSPKQQEEMGKKSLEIIEGYTIEKMVDKHLDFLKISKGN